MGSRASERGQAATDYVALLAVVCVLLAGAGLFALPGAPGVANAVVAQMRRALCIVGGEACRSERARPCVVSSARDHRHLAATIAIVRLDDDHVLLRERLSDGSVRLTVAEHSGGGMEVGLGAHARVKLGARAFGFGTHLRAALLGMLGDGRVFHARDDAEADRIVRAVMHRELPAAIDRPYRIVRRLLAGGGDHGPRADEVFVEGGVKGLAEAGVRAHGVSAGVDGVAEAALGARLDRRTGEATVYLRAGRAGEALAAAALGAGAGALDGYALLAVTLDRRRRPVELAVLASGEVQGGAGLAPALAGLLGTGAARSSGGPGLPRRPPTGGRRWELDARIDLTDPAVAAAWAALRRAPSSRGAIGALGEQLRTRAHLDARAYRTTSATRGLSAGVGAGVGFGGEIERTLDSSKLLAASTRPSGGAWEARTDCVAR